MFEPTIIITACPGREDNVREVLASLRNQTVVPERILIYSDGPGFSLSYQDTQGAVLYQHAEKHVPGLEQPRNIAARVAETIWKDTTHVWFLDSDVVLNPRAYESMQVAYSYGDEKRIMICPYSWLPDGMRPNGNWDEFFAQAENVKNDPRSYSFELYTPANKLTNDLSAGLACFSGNLVWNLEEFKRVGGYWSEIHHGRCEDGELGLRAVAMDVPISFNQGAAGFHLAHPINHSLVTQRNARDVPMLNERHPWVERGAVFMVDREGAAFDVNCHNCHKQVPTGAWWEHARSCGIVPAITIGAKEGIKL